MSTSITDYLKSTSRQLERQLTSSAKDFLRIGLELFHKQRDRTHFSIQPPLGNLAIAIELLLKAFIVRTNPVLVFQNLPIEARLLFTCPDAIPDTFNWRPFDVKLKSFAFETIKLDKCISIFYVLCPQHKQAFQPYFRLLSQCRNLSVHASLPSFHTYDLERTGYIALRLVEVLNKSKAFEDKIYYLSETDERFLANFKEQRNERVRKKIEEAKTKAQRLDHKGSFFDVDEWELYVIACPLCSCDSILAGYTDVSGDMDEDGPSLEFFADSFQCEECGLTLDDVEELKLAGMDTHFDRSEDLDQWFAEEDPPDYDEY